MANQLMRPKGGQDLLLNNLGRSSRGPKQRIRWQPQDFRRPLDFPLHWTVDWGKAASPEEGIGTYGYREGKEH